MTSVTVVPSPRSPRRWSRAELTLERLPAAVDLVVIGGGITGAGVALDAADRGASVLLVERDDLASGTSSRSSRLVHGGARYLANGDLAMVAEGVRERERLRRMAPHLVLPLPFVVPTDSSTDRALLRTGMTLYDALAGGRAVARHRGLTAAEVLQAAPGLATGHRRGGVRYYDARTDDARLTLEVARAAWHRGATVASHVAAVGLEQAGGRVRRVQLHDRLTGEQRPVEASAVVSAAGVWAGQVAGLGATDPLAVTGARGIHLVFDRRDLPVNEAVVLPSVHGDGRRLFVIPWGRQAYVGTTDDPHGDDLDRVHVTDADARYVLESLRVAFGTDLRLEHAVGAWVGLRPLLRGGDEASTADLSRRHAVLEGPAGLWTVTGGKLTTFRAMAADVVDRVAAANGWTVRRSRTTGVRLGSDGPVTGGRAQVRQLARRAGIDVALADGIHHRHGDRAAAVLDLAVAHDETDPLVEGLPYLVGEVRWAARHELCGRLDDVLSRRLRVSTRHRQAGGQAAVTRAAAIVAEELGWDAGRQTREVEGYLAAVRDERGPVPLRW